MNFANVKKLATKDFVQLKKRLLFTTPGLILVSLIFVLPSILNHRQSQIVVSNKLFESYENSDLSNSDLLNIVLLDINFGFLILLPAFLAPLYFTIDIIIGEKESRTLEGLFMLPISDKELLLGKMALGFVAGVAISWLMHVFYFIFFLLVTSQVVAFHLIGSRWIIISLLIVPTGAFFLNTISILLSCVVRKVKNAQMWASLIVVPFYVFFMLISQGSIIISNLLLGLATVFMSFLDLFLFLVALRLFKRERILLTY